MPSRDSGSAALARGLREPGAIFAGRYRVEARLGVGGMGAVYRVKDEPTGRTLALKQFGGPAASVDSGRHRMRFRREFHTMARLRHPRIVEAYEFGIDGDTPFYTMELLDGRDLGDMGVLTPTRVCELLRDVGSALAFLHMRRLIHRDLAPRNVRCTGDGRAKLIDFGVLATTGFCGDIAGTAPLISPENVRGLPIDHRADLFGLGALAYWLLTRRHAYPAHHIDELEELWRTRPLPPSAYTAEVPLALDELVMSMLSLDPLGRPAMAAEVIERLGAIGGLSPAPEVEMARGYLASAAMVGRHREMDVMRRRIGKATKGDGGALIVEAPSGRGKSRLLREVGLEAQVGGATVLSADSDAAGKGPYGLLRALARALLTAAPEDALATARPRAPLLARVLPELRERLGPIALAPAVGGPEEERMRVQAELTAWFLAVADKRTLVLLVDDIQRSDEASAAVLTSLAHAASGRRLVVAVALRTDEAIRASAAIVSLREVATRVRVRALESKDVEELVRGMFGDVPHLARLATWMQKAGGGSPLHCTELARHLVDRGVIRYEGGVWSVPEELKLEGMPKRLAEAMEARVTSLTPRARALAEALSVHGGDLPLPLCVELAGGESDKPTLAAGMNEQDVFVALDELLYEEILIGADESYHFRHDGLREALLRKLEPERRKALHLLVGRALAGAGEVTPEREAEVGWHLLEGGERHDAAKLLARAGSRLYNAQSFSDAVAPLEAALEVYEAERNTPSNILGVRHMLVMAGCFSARPIALKYADDTIAAFARISGASIAKNLSRFMPRLVALAIGMACAWLGWLFSRPSRRGPTPMAALQSFYTLVAYTSVVRSLSLHIEEGRKLVTLLEPLAVFKKRVPGGAHLFAGSIVAMTLGRLGLARALSHEILDILASDHLTPLSDIDRRSAQGGAYYMQTMAYVLTVDPLCIDEISRLEGLKLKYFEVCANICRLAYRRYRGEEDAAIDLEAKTDLMLVQAGSMWGPEAQMVWLSGFAYGLTRDVLGLRRSIRDLGRLAEQGFAVEPHIELARGEYYRERGELALSRTALEHALHLLAPDEAFVRGPALGALAETLLGEGDILRAMDVAKQAIALGETPEVGDVVWRLRGTRALALAEAANGDIEGAGRRLDVAILEASTRGSPSIAGSLHEARARVALLAGDVAVYTLNRNATDSWFRATRNPALIARIERLPDPALVLPAPSGESLSANDATAIASPSARGASRSITYVTGDAVTIADVDDARAWVSAVLTGCRGPMERATRSLEILVEAASSAAGYLYLHRDGGLQLMAPAYGEEPPDALPNALEALEARLEEPAFADRIEVAWQPDIVRGEVEWFGALLAVVRGGERMVIGAVGLVGSAKGGRTPPRLLVEQVARELYEAGDVTAGSGSKSASHS